MYNQIKLLEVSISTMTNIEVSPVVYIAVIIAFILLIVLNIILELRLNSLRKILRVWLVLGSKTEYIWYSLFGYSREQIIEAVKKQNPGVELPPDNR